MTTTAFETNPDNVSLENRSIVDGLLRDTDVKHLAFKTNEDSKITHLAVNGQIIYDGFLPSNNEQMKRAVQELTNIEDLPANYEWPEVMPSEVGQGLFGRVFSLFGRGVRYITGTAEAQEEPTVNISPQKLQAIKDQAVKIYNRGHVNKTFDVAKVHAIADIDKTKLSKISCVVSLVAMVALCSMIIGTGSLLTNAHIINASAGIQGMSNTTAGILAGVGGSITIAYTGLLIKAMKSKDPEKQLNKVMLQSLKWIREKYMFSNINDLSGGAYFILTAVMLASAATLLHNPSLITLQGCLAYPAGALMIMSGILNLYEIGLFKVLSCKDKESRKLEFQKLLKNVKDKEWIGNFLASISVMAIGYFTLVGLANTLPGIISNFAVGTFFLMVNILLLKKAKKYLNEFKNIKDKTPEDKRLFLENLLSLTDNAINQMLGIYDWNEENVQAWIHQHKEAEDIVQTFERYQALAEEDEAKDIEFLEIKKMIINEEIKNSILENIKAFGSSLEYDVLANAVAAIGQDDDAFTKAFDEVYKNLNRKFKVEIVKAVLINSPLLVFPVLQMANMINPIVYDVATGASLLGNLGVNLNPDWRNVGMATLGKYLNGNQIHARSLAGRTVQLPEAEAQDALTEETATV